jgi:hypothetical protein
MMRTFTFYSYKGGVGRSLLVANTAKYLSTLGKRVFALDLDLEAPGLHYKFELGPETARTAAAVGVVDILVKFLKTGSLPQSLAEYTTQVPVSAGAGAIRIMRAGTAPYGDYWRTLSEVNWYDLFYGKEPIGVPFFLELKERIRLDFSPDFLLIDARTGITEMGGVATTVLPDTVVCLALVSIEHLEGLRAVMRGIMQTTAQEGAHGSVSLVTVLSRVPIKRDGAIEDGEVARVRSFLNTPIQDGEAGLELDEVVTLHSEPLLDSQEQLLVGGRHSLGELPLLRDYLKLFSKIIPAEDTRPHVGLLIHRATSRILDDPDGAQSDLEALTTFCADPEVYRALIKLYQLRKAPLDKILPAAALMWQLGLSNHDSNQFLLSVVRAAFADVKATDVQKKYAEFAEAIWRSSDMKDLRFTMTLVVALLPERRERAVRLLSDHIERADPPSPAAIVRLIDLLRSALSWEPAFAMVERFKTEVAAPEFHVAWARLVLDQSDSALARRTIEDTSFRADGVRSEDPASLYRLLTLAKTDSSITFPILVDAIESAASAQDVARLRGLGEIMLDEGRWDEFDARIRGRIPNQSIRELQEFVQLRARRTRLRSR